jgi:hypothetical protein
LECVDHRTLDHKMERKQWKEKQSIWQMILPASTSI